MPILAAEPSVYPEELFHTDVSCLGERRLYVLHAKPRQEKALARHLYAAELPFYLPLLHKRALIRAKVVHSLLPLFPGYVFVAVAPAERAGAIFTRHVVRSLDVP